MRVDPQKEGAKAGIDLSSLLGAASKESDRRPEHGVSPGGQPVKISAPPASRVYSP